MEISESWVRRCSEAIERRDGSTLAECVHSACNNSADSVSFLIRVDGEISTSAADVEASLRRRFQRELQWQSREAQRYVEFVIRLAMAQWIFALPGEVLEKRMRMFKGLLAAFDAFCDVHMEARLPGRRPGWDTPALIDLVHTIQGVARLTNATDEDTIGVVVRSWRRLVVFLQEADGDFPLDVSRRRGALPVLNGLLSILFGKGNTHQCRVFIKLAEEAEFASDRGIVRAALHMHSEVAMFRYYQGRMRLLDRNPAGAFISLQDAYFMCPPLQDSTPLQKRNKLRILFYWMISGLLCGLQPPDSLLSADSVLFRLFSPIIDAIKSGNVIAYARAIDLQDSIFRKRGVYMLLHQGRLLCYLNMIRKIHEALGNAGSDASRIPFSLLSSVATAVASAALREVKVDSGRLMRVDPACYDKDSMALWMARLVSRGFIKGYLSYEYSVLVVSKKDPFPPLTPQ